MNRSASPCPARVASRKLASDVSDLLNTLDSLRELDANLSAMEESFALHYPGVIRVAAGMTDITPEVTSQGEAINKARNGLKAAQEVKKGLTAILAVYPEDKTVKRALADAETMIARFAKHDADCAKVIRTLAKKQMPDALKKYAKKVEAILTPRFVDPAKLQVIPWVSTSSVYVPATSRYGNPTSIRCLAFSVVFRVSGLPPWDEPYEGGAKLPPRQVQLTITEKTAGDEGTRIEGLNSYGMDDLKQGPAYFAEKLLEMLKGWNGLQGEEAASVDRKRTADQIASALASVARRLGTDGSDKPEVDRAGLSVYVSFRTGIRSEDFGQYDDEWSARGNKLYKPPAEAALAPFKDKIKTFSLSYGEKGWWGYHVELK